MSLLIFLTTLSYTISSYLQIYSICIFALKHTDSFLHCNWCFWYQERRIIAAYYFFSIPSQVLWYVSFDHLFTGGTVVLRLRIFLLDLSPLECNIMFFLFCWYCCQIPLFPDICGYLRLMLRLPQQINYIGALLLKTGGFA